MIWSLPSRLALWNSPAGRLGGLILAACLASGSGAHASSLAVSADAHIDGTNKAANFGTNDVLSLKQSDLGGNKAYLLFDASGWGPTNLTRVEHIRLVWSGSTTITRTLALCLITGTGANDWTETGINWNNAPANNVTGTDRNFVAAGGQTVTVLGSMQYVAGSPRELSIPLGAGTAQEKALRDALNTGTRKVTLGVNYSSSQSTAVEVYAREAAGGTFAPALEVVGGPVPTPPMTDLQLFSRLNLAQPGLEAVQAAVATNNLSVAKAELARYYRERTGLFHYIDAHNPAASVPDPASVLRSAQPLVNRTGDYAAKYWDGDVFDWEAASMSSKERMYFFEAFGQAAAVETGTDVARALVNLMRSFAWQYRSPPTASGGMWATMNAGIRMRTGWPVAFQCLLQSPAFTDEDIVLFLKTVWDQTDYIYRNPSDTSNWLTFEMAGLYTSGVVYPEFRDAQQWRRLACETALKDIARGWLPDGMSIEKSASYGTFFSNYFVMYDLARFVGRLTEFNFIIFPARTEPLFETYVKLMAPDRWTPCVNDGGQVDVTDVLSTGLDYFPGRDDFRWMVTQGQAGARPAFTSAAFPYAGYLVLRSGWETDANYLLFDAGPVGYRHAHQDKLNVVMWAYGRPVLLDSPQPGESADWTYLNYLRDTFAHSTGLVDNRPQRRRWYTTPNPSQMPYQPLNDFAFAITEGGAWGGGSYTDNYGQPGSLNNDSYPYRTPSNFYDGWGAPASHFRQVAYSAPDIFIVQDWFMPNDTGAHTYEIRWQLDSTAVSLSATRARTTGSTQPNLVVIPLRTNGVTVSTVSGKLTPEVMGWKLSGGTVRAVTTLRHVRTGTGGHSFVTLLYPLRKGVASEGITFQEQAGVISVQTADGRVYAIHPAASPGESLSIEDGGFKDTDGDGIPDWWEIKHAGGPTKAVASALAANGVNTLREAYLAGLEPADPTARFEVQGRWQDGQMLLSWHPALAGRTYDVLWSTNLAEGFQVQASVAGPVNTHTNLTVDHSGFYRIRVQRAP